MTIDATLTAAPAAQLVIVLQGSALATGGIEMHASQVTIGPPPAPSHIRGRLPRYKATT